MVNKEDEIDMSALVTAFDEDIDDPIESEDDYEGEIEIPKDIDPNAKVSANQ